VLFISFQAFGIKEKGRNKVVRKLLPIILLSLIPLSGCSSPESERELKYDEADLIRYEHCLATVRIGFGSEGVRRQILDNKWESLMEIPDKLCADSKPVKK
jgi:hypothetical protein